MSRKNLLWWRFLIRASLRNLWRVPRRTLISVLAIGASAAALILFQSFVTGVGTTFRQNLIHTAFGQYEVYKKGYRTNKGQDPFGYQVTDQAALRSAIESRVGKLAFLTGRLELFGLLSVGERTISAKGIGIDALEERKYLTKTRVATGKHLADSPEKSIFIGQGLATQLGLKTGDTVTVLVNTKSGSLNAADLEVCGTFHTGVQEIDDNMFYVPLSIAQSLLHVTGASEVLFAFQDEEELHFRPALQSLIANEFPSLELLHWHDLIGEFFDNSMLWIESQFKVFRIIIVVIAALSILNVFTMGLMERMGEFGTFRAMGTRRSEIVSMIFLESMLQAGLGAGAGVLLGLLVIQFGLRHGLTMPPPPNMSDVFHVTFVVPWNSLLSTLALCTAIAGGAGIFPAIKMARVNIVQALGRNV